MASAEELRELGINDLRKRAAKADVEVTGTGKKGAIRKEDLVQALADDAEPAPQTPFERGEDIAAGPANSVQRLGPPNPPARPVYDPSPSDEAVVEEAGGGKVLRGQALVGGVIYPAGTPLDEVDGLTKDVRRRYERLGLID